MYCIQYRVRDNNVTEIKSLRVGEIVSRRLVLYLTSCTKRTERSCYSLLCVKIDAFLVNYFFVLLIVRDDRFIDKILLSLDVEIGTEIRHNRSNKSVESRCEVGFVAFIVTFFNRKRVFDLLM